MKISYNWLRQFIPAIPSPQETSLILTNIGLEVESLERVDSIPGGLRDLVIGLVLEREQHPNADRLSLTRVDIGADAPLQIVCGAPNVAAGQKVIVATEGSTVHPVEGEPFQINRSKIRGEWSEGMICAEDEIGLGSDHNGIMVLSNEAPVGTLAKDYFKIEEDYVFEIGLTPNRADAASHLGVARDLAAALDMPFVKPSIDAFKPGTGQPVAIKIEHPEACPRYSGLSISGIKVAESPDWLKNRLRAVDLKPINNVVDITNFVMLELGQPLHAFDAAAAGNSIIVKTLPAGTSFTTLDGVKRSLSSEDLMICNEKEAMCIAGVFGGLNSGITSETTSIFLESACFNPVWIRKTSKRHALKTDASFRFERGTDPEITTTALKRAALLINEVAGGTIASSVADHYPKPVAPVEITVSYQSIGRLIGQAIPHDTIKSILKRLEIEIIAETADGLKLRVPAFKVDVTREADIVEEILRIYGYNKIAIPQKLRASLSYSEKPDKEQVQEQLSAMLVANGFFEIMSNSLTRSAYYEGQPGVVAILNPLSMELDVLRKDLLFSGLEAIAYNRNRKQEDLRFFEFGKGYIADKSYREPAFLSLFLTGRSQAEQWNTGNDRVGFFHLKGIIDAIINRFNIRLHVSETADPVFLTGLDGLMSDGTRLLRYGQIAPGMLKTMEIDAEVYYAEIAMDVLLTCAGTPVQFKEIPKYPAVRRDLSMLLDESVSFGTLRDLAFATEKHILTEVSIFDVYQGEHVPPGKKSYALSFTLQDAASTLTDKQIDHAMNRIMQTYERQAGASIRK